MSTTADRLLEEALRLSEDERASLVADILSTLPPDVPSEERAADEWIAVIEERAQAAVDGKPGVPWNDVRSEIEGRLAQT